MLPEVQSALKLQEIDIRIAALRSEIATLPKQIKQIETALDSHTKRLELDRLNLAANLRDRKKHELDIQTQQQKISKLRDQMNDAKTNEQYRAFQHEIEFCENAIRKSEDSILDLMNASEKLEQAVKTAEEALKKEKAVVDAEKASATARTDEDKRELAKLLSERESVVAALPKPVYATYERLRTRSRDGKAVAEVSTDGRCMACNGVLRPQYFQELKAEKQLLQCENCRRILHYQPPQRFDNHIDAPITAGA